MNKALIVTVLLGVAALGGVLYATKNSQSPSFLKAAGYKYENEFKRFAIKYQKQYGHDEGFFRYKNFEANMDLIKAHNALYDAGNSSFFLDVNQLADLNSAEYKAIYLGYKPQAKKAVAVTEEEQSNVEVPRAVDWVRKGAVNAVKNQGQCGSCWAFSAVAALEGLNFVTNGHLQSFSEQSVVDCSTSYGNQGCNGGLMDAAFQYTKASGIPTESSYPYTGEDGSCRQFTSVFKNGGHKDVTPNSESALVAAVARQPVSVAIEADTSAFQFYSGGILKGSSCGTQLDHGVAVVGYGADFYKVRNSWGTTWGEQGYVRLARVGNGAGQCGLQVEPSYPTA